jgi:hypothetical protein
MLRTFSLSAAVLAMTFILSIRPAAGGEHEHDVHFMKCARACTDCQLQCDSCFKHCLSLLADSKKEHLRTAQLCADCGECCKLAATLAARQSPLAGLACECCAKCCDECGAACERVPDDKHMAQCAKSCQDCAKACREMLKQLGQGK